MVFRMHVQDAFVDEESPSLSIHIDAPQTHLDLHTELSPIKSKFSPIRCQRLAHNVISHKANPVIESNEVVIPHNSVNLQPWIDDIGSVEADALAISNNEKGGEDRGPPTRGVSNYASLVSPPSSSLDPENELQIQSSNVFRPSVVEVVPGFIQQPSPQILVEDYYPKASRNYHQNVYHSCHYSGDAKAVSKGSAAIPWLQTAGASNFPSPQQLTVSTGLLRSLEPWKNPLQAKLESYRRETNRKRKLAILRFWLQAAKRRERSRLFYQRNLVRRVFLGIRAFAIVARERAAAMAALTTSLSTDAARRDDLPAIGVAMVHDRRRCLRRVFRAWARRTRSLQLVATVTCHYQATLLRRALQAWRDFWEERKMVYASAMRFETAKATRLCRGVLLAWAAETARRRVLLESFHRVLALHQKTLLARVLNHWHQHALLKAAASQQAKEMAKANRICLVKTVLVRWHDAVGALRAEREAAEALATAHYRRRQLRSAGGGRDGQLVAEVLRRWWAATRESQRYGLSDLACRHRLLRTALRCWHEHLAEAKEREILLMQARCFRRTHLKVYYFKLWVAAQREKQRVRTLEKVALCHWTLSLQAKVWRAWLCYLEEVRALHERKQQAFQRYTKRLAKFAISLWLEAAFNIRKSELNNCETYDEEKVLRAAAVWQGSLPLEKRPAVFVRKFDVLRAELPLSKEVLISDSTGLASTTEIFKSSGPSNRLQPKIPDFLLDSLSPPNTLTPNKPNLFEVESFIEKNQGKNFEAEIPLTSSMTIPNNASSDTIGFSISQFHECSANAATNFSKLSSLLQTEKRLDEQINSLLSIKGAKLSADLARDVDDELEKAKADLEHVKNQIREIRNKYTKMSLIKDISVNNSSQPRTRRPTSLISDSVCPRTSSPAASLIISSEQQQQQQSSSDLGSLHWLQNGNLIQLRPIDNEEECPGNKQPTKLQVIDGGQTILIQEQGAVVANGNAVPIVSTSAAVLSPQATATYTDKMAKPLYSYTHLIFMAIESSPLKCMTVNQIYTWCMNRFPFFKHSSTGWKNSLRHNLSINKSFRRLPRDGRTDNFDTLAACSGARFYESFVLVDELSSDESPGRGSFWAVEPKERANLMDAIHRNPYTATLARERAVVRPITLSAVQPVVTITSETQQQVNLATFSTATSGGITVTSPGSMVFSGLNVVTSVNQSGLVAASCQPVPVESVAGAQSAFTTTTTTATFVPPKTTAPPPPPSDPVSPMAQSLPRTECFEVWPPEEEEKYREMVRSLCGPVESQASPSIGENKAVDEQAKKVNKNRRKASLVPTEEGMCDHCKENAAATCRFCSLRLAWRQRHHPAAASLPSPVEAARVLSHINRPLNTFGGSREAQILLESLDQEQEAASSQNLSKLLPPTLGEGEVFITPAPYLDHEYSACQKAIRSAAETRVIDAANARLREDMYIALLRDLSFQGMLQEADCEELEEEGPKETRGQAVKKTQRRNRRQPAAICDDFYDEEGEMDECYESEGFEPEEEWLDDFGGYAKNPPPKRQAAAAPAKRRSKRPLAGSRRLTWSRFSTNDYADDYVYGRPPKTRPYRRGFRASKKTEDDDLLHDVDLDVDEEVNFEGTYRRPRVNRSPLSTIRLRQQKLRSARKAVEKAVPLQRPPASTKSLSTTRKRRPVERETIPIRSRTLNGKKPAQKIPPKSKATAKDSHDDTSTKSHSPLYLSGMGYEIPVREPKASPLESFQENPKVLEENGSSGSHHRSGPSSQCTDDSSGAPSMSS